MSEAQVQRQSLDVRLSVVNRVSWNGRSVTLSDLSHRYNFNGVSWDGRSVTLSDLSHIITVNGVSWDGRSVTLIDLSHRYNC